MLKKRLKCSKTVKLFNKFSFQLNYNCMVSYKPLCEYDIVKIYKKNSILTFTYTLSFLVFLRPASGSELNLKQYVFFFMKGLT